MTYQYAMLIYPCIYWSRFYSAGVNYVYLKMFVFLLIYLASFVISLRDVIRGKTASVLTFIIFGLSLYYTAMSVAFMLGLAKIIPAFQVFKELLIILAFVTNLLKLKSRPRLHLIDYLILIYFSYLCSYAVLPIGAQSFGEKLVALKSHSFYLIVYFTARLTDIREVYISKYFNYIVLLAIAAGIVLTGELMVGAHLQTFTGYADYSYYFFNFEPEGNFRLNWTFESDGGVPRHASFFTSPLEFATATVFALATILGLFTDDRNRLRINEWGMTALGATLLAIIFAISRAPLASYGLVVYVYALVTKKKAIVNTVHTIAILGALYVSYLFLGIGASQRGLTEVLMNTIDFSDPSSAGHVIEWVIGIMAMVSHPLGLGLGSSGRVAGSIGETVGGENQFIIIGVQVGIIALLLYLSVYIMFIKKSIGWLKVLQGKERKLCLTVLLMKVGILISLFTSEVESSSYVSYLNWFFSGLLISTVMQYHASKVASPTRIIAA